MKTTWKKACAFSTALCLLAVTQAMGQVRQPGDQDNALQRRDATQQRSGQQKFALASKMTNMSVKDKSNQNIGQIQDLLIDQDGKVQYLAISTQGQAGAGTTSPATRSQPGQTPGARTQPGQTPGARTGQQADPNAKLVLVPFDAVELHTGETATQNYVSLKDIDKDRLSQAPSFTRQQLTSQQQQAQWMSQVDQFFDREKSGAARPDLNNQDRNKQNQDKEEKERDRE